MCDYLAELHIRRHSLGLRQVNVLLFCLAITSQVSVGTVGKSCARGLSINLDKNIGKYDIRLGGKPNNHKSQSDFHRGLLQVQLFDLDFASQGSKFELKKMNFYLS